MSFAAKAPISTFSLCCRARGQTTPSHKDPRNCAPFARNHFATQSNRRQTSGPSFASSVRNRNIAQRSTPKSAKFSAPATARPSSRLPSICGTCPAMATSPAKSAKTTPSMNRAMIVVVSTVPIFSPSIRAMSHDRTSGLIPSGTSTFAPYPARSAPVSRMVRTGLTSCRICRHFQPFRTCSSRIVSASMMTHPIWASPSPSTKRPKSRSR